MSSTALHVKSSNFYYSSSLFINCDCISLQILEFHYNFMMLLCVKNWSTREKDCRAWLLLLFIYFLRSQSAVISQNDKKEKKRQI